MRILTISLLLLSLCRFQTVTAQTDSTAFFEAEEHFEQIISFLSKGNCDSVFWAAEKSIEGFSAYEAWTLVVQVNIYTANCYYYKDKQSFYRHVEYTSKLAQEKLDPNDIILPFIYNLQGIAYNEQADYEKAISYYLKAVAIDSLPTNSYGKFYSNLGLNYRLKGDYGEAKRYYEYGRDLIIQSMEEDIVSFRHGNLARATNKLAKVYRLEGNYTQALSYYHEVDSLYLFVDLDNAYKGRIDCAHSMAYCYLGQKQAEMVRAQLERALSLQAGREVYQEEVRAEILGELAFYEGDIDQALQQLRQALEISQTKNKPKESQIRIAQRITDILIQAKDYSEAEQQLQSALGLIAQSGASAPEDYIYPSLGIPLLAQMAELQAEIANSQNEPARIDSALQLYQRLKALVRHNRNNFRADNSRLFLASQTLPIYEKAIGLCYQVYQRTNDPRYLEEAFSFSELGKATLLRESLQSNAASTHFSVPDSLKEKERAYQRNIAFYKEQLFLNPLPENETANDSSKQAVWQRKLFELENEYRALNESLELQYPVYYQEKYRVKAITLADVQAYLNSDQLLVEYYWGEEEVFIFKISQDQLILEKIAIEPALMDALAQSKQFLSRPTASAEATLQFQKDARLLYAQLLGDVSSYPELILIPAGPLGYLSFDILLTEEIDPAEELRFHELPYLLKKHRLYYQYSADLLFRSSKQERKASIAYGGFAPSYPALPNAQRGAQMVLNQPLPQLAFTQEEVSNTHAIWGGNAYLNEAATKETFLKDASQYNLLHLAMHGLLSGENTEFAALAFHPESDSAGQFLLSMEEIAAMELAAELVVLSACETGAGRLRRGEGVMSMARAFREAGCPNILMSLWTADDKSSTLIMQDFFGRLKAGEDMAESVRAAKLHLMSSQFLQSHPYYWAGFVPLGNPPQSNHNSHLQLIILMLLVGVGIGLMAYRTESI